MSEARIYITDGRVDDNNSTTSVFFNKYKCKNIIKNYIYDACKLTIPATSFPEESKL